MPRSALYMPANNPRALAKAPSLACDAVILDLEDSVAPTEKAAARQAAAAAMADPEMRARPLILRTNALDSPAFEA
ncbi:MAG: aldolase/citrate lyase family protein, partial [Alphaproteobacteria bacterium]